MNLGLLSFLLGRVVSFVACPCDTVNVWGITVRNTIDSVGNNVICILWIYNTTNRDNSSRILEKILALVDDFHRQVALIDRVTFIDNHAFNMTRNRCSNSRLHLHRTQYA